MSKPSFPSSGLVRLSAILAPCGSIPVSKSTWWAGVREGRFPQPIKLGPRTTVWRVEDSQSDAHDYRALQVSHDASRLLISRAKCNHIGCPKALAQHYLELSVSCGMLENAEVASWRLSAAGMRMLA